MNLREEIYNRIKQSFPDNNPNTMVFLTDKILKLIEKRIDSIKPMDDEEYLAGHVTFQYAIKQMKEMLK